MKTPIEKDILRYGLFIGILFQIYQTAFSFGPDVPRQTMVINLTMLGVLGLLLFMTEKGKHELAGLILHILVLTAFTFFWANYGGFAGTVPSFMCVYITFIIISSSGFFQWVSLLLMVLQLILFFQFPELLGMDNYYQPEKIGALQHAIDFVAIGGILVLFSLYMKNKFIFYRKKVAKRYHQMNSVANTLEINNKRVTDNQEEIKVINENLESIIQERIVAIEEKNRSLEEYAFINAHTLRGPLCRIIGLINLIERESGSGSQELQQIKLLSKQIDEEVRKINSIVAD
jgi:signal transduction histidine kinase